MGQSRSRTYDSPEHVLPETICDIQDEVFRQTKFFTEIAILTYEEFQDSLRQLNELSKKVVDHNGKQLLFAIKKGTDSTVLWKGTVKISCIKLDEKTKIIESHKLLSLNQFLKIFKTLECQLIAAFQSSQKELKEFSNQQKIVKLDKDSLKVFGSGSECFDESDHCVHDNFGGNKLCKSLNKEITKTSLQCKDPTLSGSEIEKFSASVLLEQVNNLAGSMNDSIDALGECIICLERKPDVMLPCAHAYCLPCIEQWNAWHNTCPFCREKLDNTDETWVISDMPASQEINDEICSELRNLTE